MLHATLYLHGTPWAMPDLDAVALPNCCLSLTLLPRVWGYQGATEGLPRSYLFAEDLLALGIVDPRCPAPVRQALPVAII